jgi:hypothetical protein
MRVPLAFLILVLLQKDPSLERHFLSPTEQMSEDQKRLWIQLLPQLFIVCPKLQLSFLRFLLQASPANFLVQFRDIECRGIIKDQEHFTVLKEAFIQKPNDRYQRDISLFCSFLDRCKDDLEKLDRSVEALEILFRYLALGRFEAISERSHFGNIDDVLAFCEASPPVFKPSHPFPEFFSLYGIKAPLFGHGTNRMILEADGTHEALIRLIPFYGESRVVTLVSPRLYRFSQAEYFVLINLARMFHNHASCVTRAFFVSYPESYMIHPRLLAIDTAAVVSFRDIAQPYNFLRLLLVANAGGSGRDVPARAGLPDDLFLNWAIRGADGNRANFLFCRQGIASHYAAISCLQVIFRPTINLVPPILFGVDRQRVMYPGMLLGVSMAVFPPLTDQIRRYLPDFVLRGTFTATWHAVAMAMAKNIPKVQMLVEALLPAERSHAALPLRIERTAVAVSNDTDKSDVIWAFDLVDHLIECSTNVMRADSTRLAWI